MTPLANTLENSRDALPEANAHRGDAEIRATIDHRVDQRRRDAGAASPERMADGNRATADIDLRFIEAEHADASQRLRGKRLIELDQIDVLERQATSFQDLFDGR